MRQHLTVAVLLSGILAMPAVAAPASEPSWSPVVTLAGPSTVQAGDVAIGTAADGRTAAIYAFDKNAVSTTLAGGILTRRSGTWLTGSVLGPSEAVLSIQPKLAMSPRGEGVALWSNGDFPSSEATVAFLDAGAAAWGEPEGIPGPRLSRGGDIAVRDGGDAVAVWTVGDALAQTTSVVAATRAGRTGAWSAPSVLGALGASKVKVALGRDGETIAVWERAVTGGRVIESATRTAAGAWSAPESISLIAPENRRPAIAIAPDGRAVAVWVEDAVMVSERPAGGSWTTPAAISDTGGFPDLFNLAAPQVAIAGDGAAVVAWRRVVAPNRFEVEAAVRPRSGSWSAPETLSPTATRSAGRPHLAVNESGDAVVGWIHPRASDGDLRVAIGRAEGGGWSASEVVTAPSERPTSIDVSIDGDGGVVAAWRSRAIDADDPNGSRLRASVRESTPPTTLTLTADQLLINQRISQAAVRRANAVLQRLEDGLVGADLRDGALGDKAFAADLTAVGADTGAFLDPVGGRPLSVAPSPGTGGTIALTADQLLINQRISQAALRRIEGLTDALDSGLTGGNFTDGSISAAKIAPGIALTPAPATPASAPTEVAIAPAPSRDPGARVALTADQLLINQRISQAAVRRVNALVARMEAGLLGADIAPGSISAVDLAP